MSRIGVFLFLIFVFLFSEEIRSQSIAQPSIADAMVRINSTCPSWQTTPWGTAFAINATTWTWNSQGCGQGNTRAYIQFDLNPAVSHQALYDNRATVNLFFPTGYPFLTEYKGTATDNMMYMQRVTAPWDEMTMTWDNQAPITTTSQVTVPSSVSGPSEQDYSFDASAFVYGWICGGLPNYGVRFILVNEGQLYRNVTIATKEFAVVAKRPTLGLEYAVIDATGPDTICYGATVPLACSLTNAANPAVYNFQWMHINSGMQYNTQNVSNAQAVSGLNTYVVTVTNPWCQTARDTVEVFVSSDPVPVISLNASETSVCFGESINLSATGAETYNWSNGGSGSSISLIPSASGTYSVTGISTNGCPGTSSISITVNPNPTINATASPASVCIGNNTGLSATGANSYSWSDGNSGSNIIVTPAASTIYTVTGTSTSGCTGTALVSFGVNPLPNVSAFALSDTICDGSQTNLAATGAVSYLWSSGNTGNNIVVSPSSSMTYSVVGTSSAGCTGSATVAIIVNPNPTPVILGDASVCVFENAALTAFGGDTYLWSTGQSTPPVQIPFNTAGSFTVYVLATDTNGCADTAFQTITVNPLPAFDLGADTSICDGDSVLLNTSITGASYSWNTGATNQTISVDSAGVYSVTVTDSNSCSYNDSIEVTVFPWSDATIQDELFVCENSDPFTFTAAESGGVWSGAGIINTSTGLFDPENAGSGSITIVYEIDGLCGNSDSTVIEVAPAPGFNTSVSGETCSGASDGVLIIEILEGTPPFVYLLDTTVISDTTTNLFAQGYLLIITDTRGCTISDSVHIPAEDFPCGNIDFYIPNIFSPNGDQQNDVLFVRSSFIFSFEWNIYDRFGELVFESKSIDSGWDGEFQGLPVQSGVYFWHIKATMLDESVIEREGNVTVVR